MSIKMVCVTFCLSIWTNKLWPVINYLTMTNSTSIFSRTDYYNLPTTDHQNCSQLIWRLQDIWSWCNLSWFHSIKKWKELITACFLPKYVIQKYRVSLSKFNIFINYINTALIKHNISDKFNEILDKYLCPNILQIKNQTLF